MFDDWSEFGVFWKNGPLDISHSELVAEAKPFHEAPSTTWISKGEKLTEVAYAGL
ncbi:hypothetical protein K504DRAFT_501839 [Pleomassaria siparia CBS 279.74]|uniref:Uncharacterized protein n=1 Tax=Pleomassaria siparia CBS 279.74 TaxID=1314801 RepID=A0A6G1KDR7_9PLEO|nr:hypothetical protein K504DRAFT_501839 [Pleomassaria siparia CBS 279.74]